VLDTRRAQRRVARPWPYCCSEVLIDGAGVGPLHQFREDIVVAIDGGARTPPVWQRPIDGDDRPLFRGLSRVADRVVVVLRSSHPSTQRRPVDLGSSADLSDDLGSQALHLLGLIEEGVEQDHLGAGFGHLAQP
jgi:hypothetical protein